MLNLDYDILIIDDSKYIVALLNEIIKSKGFTCKAVNNTSEAIEELDKHIPKLVFLDVNLPDASGYDFCKMIKTNDKFREILVYYFTGVPEAIVAIKALETKADGYLKKPFDISDFNDILEHIKHTSCA